MNISRSIILMLFATMPIVMRLMFSVLLDKPMDSNHIVQSLSISAFTLGILAMAFFSLSINRFRSGLFIWFHAIGFIVVIGSIQFLMIEDFFLPESLKIELIVRVISILYVLSIINFFLISLFTVQETQHNEHIDDEVYIAGLKWLMIPILISGAITFLTWLLSGYQGTIVNHATIFGIYLAVIIVLKDKVAYFRTEK